ncbi:NUDIX hydrolase [Rhizobium sp. Rhizsp42]|uniref:NUDIX domain-containing protein n=1 Tax=Rhizobium sp. Rhizsp42 TaxID=3243034 RepID=UPI000DD6BFED
MVGCSNGYIDARKIYDNTLTTVFVIAFNGDGELLCIRRARAPGEGLLGLPGGYQMRGETWQEAGGREVLEETGCVIEATGLRLISLSTDRYHNNLIIARTDEPAEITTSHDDESLAVLFLRSAGARQEWAHPDLYDAAASSLVAIETP